jgi:glycine betaine/proline transport system substrate-binding protein
MYDGESNDIFQALIVMEGLKRLGYNVPPLAQTTVPLEILAVGQGDAEFVAGINDPLHNAYYAKAGGDQTMEKVGVLDVGETQGYLIDKATADKYHITNVGHFKDPAIAKIFSTMGDGKADLTGCVPGWGCERVIEHHLDAYGLRQTVRHNQGVYEAMMADTIARYKAGNPIFYYTWTPMWVSSILVPGRDVTWLDVPFSDSPDSPIKDTTMPDGHNTGFSLGKITIIANKKFLDANPAAKRFFQLVKLSIADINAENLLLYKGESSITDIQRHADQWIAAHQVAFDGWVAEAQKAH